MSLPASSPQKRKTYLIVGASRGIGLEFASQLLQAGHRVITTARTVKGGSQLWALTGTENGKNLTILECDVVNEESMRRFTGAVGRLRKLGVAAGGVVEIDVVVVNAGVLVYPNRIMETSFKDFAHHVATNTIGPLLVAQALLKLSPTLPIHTLVFISSDSGSTANFRAFEDGFAAYAASKAALNQGLRHLAAELCRAHLPTVVLALHPGEVSSNMASMDTCWDVEGIISPRESVSGMLKVIAEKGRGGAHEAGGERGAASFWTWEGRRYPW